MLQPYPTTAIGASEVNPLSMASTAAFLNGGFRVTPRFANDVCRDGKSLLYKDDDGRAKACDIKGENLPAQERIMHPAVSAAMIELLKSPLDIGPTGTASALRTGVIPGMDPLSDAIWKLKPDERKQRSLAFPLEPGGRDRRQDGHGDQRGREDLGRVAPVVRSRPARASGERHRARLLDGQGLERSSPRRSRRNRRPRVRRVGRSQLGAFGGDGARVSAEGARTAAARIHISADHARCGARELRGADSPTPSPQEAGAASTRS